MDVYGHDAHVLGIVVVLRGGRRAESGRCALHHGGAEEAGGGGGDGDALPHNPKNYGSGVSDTGGCCCRYGGVAVEHAAVDLVDASRGMTV